MEKFLCAGFCGEGLRCHPDTVRGAPCQVTCLESGKFLPGKWLSFLLVLRCFSDDTFFFFFLTTEKFQCLLGKKIRFVLQNGLSF